jgi:protein-S-isoprenylcysteine O-methyltransferase Ste14
MVTNSAQPGQPEPIDSRRLFLGVGWTLLILVLCLFLSAGTWVWLRGWVFLFVFVVVCSFSSVYLRRANPDVIVARVNRHQWTKRWDRILAPFLLLTVMAIPIVAALDDGRFHWFHVTWWGCLLGYTLLIAGFVGVTWAESVNKFFEPTVRIQTDRGHRVIDNGPYAIIRHPGYFSAGFIFVGSALSLGSLWALIPGILSFLLLVVRTVLEDRTLREELAGYEEYTQRVRYRLLPGVW